MTPQDSGPAQYNAVIAAQVQASRRSFLHVTERRQQVRSAIARSLRSPRAKLLAASIAFLVTAARGRRRNAVDRRRSTPRAAGGVIASAVSTFVVSEVVHHASLWVRRLARRDDPAPTPDKAGALHRHETRASDK